VAQKAVYWGCLTLIAASLGVGVAFAASASEEDERTIRAIVDRAVSRLNKGDVGAFDDFWDENADYVGVDGTLTKGRSQIEALFRQMAKSGGTQQSVSIEQIRFVTPEFATVDAWWTVTGARGSDGRKLAPIKGRGFELVQKKDGRWRFIATREMVVFGGN
jgi:uncharacterized protein (TIGR02246 family)